MITENGIVTAANESVAWVKTIRSSACEGCASRDSCRGQPMTLTVKNTLGVTKGDQVVIGLETNTMMFLAFFLYVFPVLCLIGGAFIGDSLAETLSLGPSVSGMLFGGVSFFLAFCVIRKTHGKLAKKDTYKPFLVKKIFAASKS